MIALSVAKLILIFRRKGKFLLNEGKKEKKHFFCEKFGSIPKFRRTQKGKKCFCDKPTSVWLEGITQNHIFIKFSRFRSEFRAFFVRISYFQIFGV